MGLLMGEDPHWLFSWLIQGRPSLALQWAAFRFNNGMSLPSHGSKALHHLHMTKFWTWQQHSMHYLAYDQS